jgi:DNA repair photolyase
LQKPLIVWYSLRVGKQLTKEANMPLTKSKGNMYQWVTHTHAHLGGECPHKCSYCYVDNPRFGRPEKYKGPVRLLLSELSVEYGKGKKIFIDHCNDLFAQAVPQDFIYRILDHCAQWPDNIYVYQTKNPYRFKDFISWTQPDCMIGCTIETNRDMPDSVSLAPRPISRYMAMKDLSHVRKAFITIEPVMDFDVDILAGWIIDIKPDFVNIGADSKKHGLPEPSADKVIQLIEALNGAQIEIREKHNLDRIIGR